jgi:protocatechuate 3,4-dioxygenase beta subunit
MLYTFLISLLCFSLTCCGQDNPKVKTKQSRTLVGGPCEGCEAIYENPVPFDAMNEVDTLPIFSEQGPKLMVSGVVYQSDGKTPAPNVILYVYQTDQTGRYRVTGSEKGWGRRHGNIRGWMKTNRRGEYKFYTVRPASYSETGPPAHIHVTVKEPDKNEYYVDDFHFSDDPWLTEEMKSRQRARGGDGILKLEKKGELFYGRRDIYLGRNVTDYPTAISRSKTGLMIGLVF